MSHIKNPRIEHIKGIISIMPETPGVYQYFDKDGEIIYVGKAKNLKKRVSSYFNKIHDSNRTNRLVKNIYNLKYIVVNTEQEALNLENNMIKAHQPRYNVLLKDDKTYPYICIKNEPYPRVFMTRKVVKDGSSYFGPYTNVKMVYALLELFRQIYKVRTCNLNLAPPMIQKGKYKVCLEYHIKNCKGPCEGLVDEQEYNEDIREIKEILRGHTSDVLDYLMSEMVILAEKLKFEQAQEIKERYMMIETYQTKTCIVQPQITNVNVYSYLEDENSIYINYFYVVRGAIIQSFTFEYKQRIDERKEDILSLAIQETEERFKSPAKEYIVPFEPDYKKEGITFTVPQRGDKKKLLELSDKNLKQYIIDKLKHAEKLNPEQRMVRILTRLKSDLQLHELPVHIECFDNSNIQGTNPVAACVVFKNAKPAKKDYRHFNVKTVEGPDDFASMYEIVGRRYKRLIEEEQPLPQLIVIDGGKGQLHAATDALKNLNLYGKIPIIGIAKRLEEIYFPEDSIPLYLDKNSESLRLIQQLRDEAHRFGITFHRNKRSKGQVVSELDSIKGIGENSKTALLKKFKSVKRIKEAPIEEIAEIVGNKKANLLKEAFMKNNNSK